MRAIRRHGVDECGGWGLGCLQLIPRPGMLGCGLACCSACCREGSHAPCYDSCSLRLGMLCLFSSALDGSDDVSPSVCLSHRVSNAAQLSPACVHVHSHSHAAFQCRAESGISAVSAAKTCAGKRKWRRKSSQRTGAEGKAGTRKRRRHKRTSARLARRPWRD